MKSYLLPLLNLTTNLTNKIQTTYDETLTTINQPLKYDSNTPIVLIHGLGGHPITMIPIKKTLELKGYTNVININYNTSGTLKECINDAQKSIEQNVSKDEEIIVIGQSLGGVIGLKLNEYDWKIKYLVTVVSPLKGSQIIDLVDNYIPTIGGIFETPVWEDLRQLKNNPPKKPDHPVTTISTSIIGTDYDSRVHVEDTKLDDNDDHHHISWSEHCTVFIDTRLLWKLYTLV